MLWLHWRRCRDSTTQFGQAASGTTPKLKFLNNMEKAMFKGILIHHPSGETWWWQHHYVGVLFVSRDGRACMG